MSDNTLSLQSDTLPRPGANIATVERDTGLAKDTLRVWERRYGFPQPVRDAFGERVYPAEQVDKLRLMRHLMDQGHRPGKIVALDIAALQSLMTDANLRTPKRAAPEECSDLLAYVELCKACQFEHLRDALWQRLREVGLKRFVLDVAAPLNMMVGNLWAGGKIAIYEEHLYTEALQAALRGGIANLMQSERRPAGPPRILLTTFPQEQHGLGLLMAEALFSLDGASCLNLGVQTPVTEIARAAMSQQVDVVALSFSAAMTAKQAASGARDLRALLPPQMEIWAGGSCPGLQRRPPPELRMLNLSAVGEAIHSWRLRHGLGMSIRSA